MADTIWNALNSAEKFLSRNKNLVSSCVGAALEPSDSEAEERGENKPIAGSYVVATISAL